MSVNMRKEIEFPLDIFKAIDGPFMKSAKTSVHFFNSF